MRNIAYFSSYTLGFVPSLVVFAVVAVAGAALLLWRLDKFFLGASRAT